MASNNYKPKYMYDVPMFLLTVSVVIIDDNGVIVIPDRDTSVTMENKTAYRFPGGIVKAGQESIQFAAVRYVKEQTGIVLKKDSLIPVDFRSEPERSLSGNMVDMGFVVVLEKKVETREGRWIEVDFSTKKANLDDNSWFSMDNGILLERSLGIVSIIKE